MNFIILNQNQIIYNEVLMIINQLVEKEIVYKVLWLNQRFVSHNHLSLIRICFFHIRKNLIAFDKNSNHMIIVIVKLNFFIIEYIKLSCLNFSLLIASFFQLTDEKGALMKEVSRLENLTKEFERELDQVKHSKYFLFKLIIKFSSFVIHYVNVLMHYN